MDYDSYADYICPLGLVTILLFEFPISGPLEENLSYDWTYTATANRHTTALRTYVHTWVDSCEFNLSPRNISSTLPKYVGLAHLVERAQKCHARVLESKQSRMSTLSGRESGVVRGIEPSPLEPFFVEFGIRVTMVEIGQ